jgi:multiple sugar transport system permease protein
MSEGEIGIRKDPLSVRFFIYMFLIAGALTMAVPYVWMLVTSIKPLEEIQSYPPSFIVKHPTIKPYADLFRMVPMMQYLLDRKSVV